MWIAPQGSLSRDLPRTRYRFLPKMQLPSQRREAATLLHADSVQFGEPLSPAAAKPPLSSLPHPPPPPSQLSTHCFASRKPLSPPQVYFLPCSTAGSRRHPSHTHPNPSARHHPGAAAGSTPGPLCPCPRPQAQAQAGGDCPRRPTRASRQSPGGGILHLLPFALLCCRGGGSAVPRVLPAGEGRQRQDDG